MNMCQKLLNNIYDCLFLKAAQILVTKARRIAVLPLSQISLFQDDIYFIIRNGPSMSNCNIRVNYLCVDCSGNFRLVLFSATILSLFNTSTFLYEENIVNSVTVMKAWALGITIGSIVILAVVLLIIVRPVVYAVEDNKSGTKTWFENRNMGFLREYIRLFFIISAQESLLIDVTRASLICLLK